MSLKNKTDDELILTLGVIIDQIKVNRRGLKDHPNSEEFKKAIPYMINEGEKIKQELEKRFKPLPESPIK